MDNLITAYKISDNNYIFYTEEFQATHKDRELLKKAGLDKVQRYQWKKGLINNKTFYKICEVIKNEKETN